MVTQSWMHDFIKSHGFLLFKGRASKSPLVLKVNLSARFIKVSLQESVSLNLEKIIILDESGEEISTELSVLASSVYNDLERFNGEALFDDSISGLGFHSKNEESPWILIDLGVIKKISGLVIYNRGDRFHTRALSVLVEVSSNLTNWRTIHDNALYKTQEKYVNLSVEDKALCSLAALQPNAAIRYRNEMVRSGNKSEALLFLEKANNILQSHRLALGPHGLNQTFSIQTKKQIEKVYTELSQFLFTLNDELRIPAFASSGTLLGLVRNGELLGHDDDIDLCYISNESTETGILAERVKIVEFLNGKGHRARQANDSGHLWVTTKAGLDLDLFTGWKKNGRCIMNPLPKNGVDISDVFPLKKIHTHSVDIYIPRKGESLMVLNYGLGWETPDPVWEFDWSHARKQYGFLYL